MKAILFIVCLGLIAAGSARTIYAQNQVANSSVPATSAGGSRQQDKLNGQVRRVRVEIAHLVVKEGKPVEGSRVVREITTYDQRGQKIDSIVYPMEERAVVGKKEFLYDTKGSVIEMVLRGDDGSILNKEKYDYQFDEFDNWKKMIASVALYENGTVSYEPFEITYRTLTYYFGQPAPKPTLPTVTPSSITSTTATTAGLEKDAKPATEPSVSVPPPSIATDDVKSSHASEAIVVKPEKTAAQVAPPPTVITDTVVPPRKPEAEEPFKTAAIDLAQPKHPQVATNSTASEPTSNQANPVISDLKVFQPAHFTEASPKPATHSPEPEASPYARGLVLLAEGRNSEAVEAFLLATQRDPKDAAASAKLGIAYTALKRYKEAVEVLKMAIRIKPEALDVEAYYQLSNAYTALEKFPQALEAIEQAVYMKRAELANPEVAGTSRSFAMADLRYSTGLAYYNLRRYSKAIEEMKQVIALNPNHAQAYYGLALSYIGNGDRKSAEKQQEILDAMEPVYAAKIAKLLSTRPNQTQGFGTVFKTSP